MGAGGGGITALATWKPSDGECRVIENRSQMKPRATILTHASQLLTLRGDTLPRRGAALRDLGIVEDGAVLIEDGKIAAVGTTDQLRRELKSRVPQVRARELGANLGNSEPPVEIDCRNQVVLPGFVDSHTHPVFAAPRLIDFEKRISGASYQEIANAGGGIRASIRGVRESSTGQLGEHVLRAFEEMAAYGTTTVEAKSGYGLSLDSELKSLEAIQQAAGQWPGTVVATLLGAHVPPPEYRDNPDEYARIICEEMIPEVVRRNLAEYVDVFCERGAFTPEQTARILRAAVANGLKTRAHVNQLTETNLHAFAEFHPASFDHMDHVSDTDIAALAKLDTVATLLPAANYFLGLGTYPQARKLIDSEVAVALATDYNPGTSPTTSMPFVKMSPAEAIVAATFNGACALGLQNQKGSLAPGKDADIAIFEATDYRELAYWFGVNRCRQSLLNGTLNNTHLRATAR
jgi:imidazolonepropionase